MDVVLDNLPAYAGGYVYTLVLSFTSFALALVLGTAIAAMRVSPVAPLRAAGLTYVETFRNIPLPVLFTLCVFGLPKLGFTFSLAVWAILALTIYHATFISEAVRSGINAVAAGQGEAARSLGLTFGQTLRLVVLPQALRSVVAPLGNIFIALTKNSAVAGVFGVAEVTQRSTSIITEFSQPVAVLIGAALAYMTITLTAAFVVDWIERQVAIVR